MGVAVIRSEQDYRRVIEEIDGLMAVRRNAREGARLAALVTLVEAWERKHYPFNATLQRR
jgi:HTH-type transcriptional regulator/antitoxin HigA